MKTQKTYEDHMKSAAKWNRWSNGAFGFLIFLGIVSLVLIPLAAYALEQHEATNYVASTGTYGTGSANGTSLVDDSGTTGVQVLDGGQVKISNAYTLPAADGTADQLLKTNGSGVLSFSSTGLGNALIAVSVIADNTIVRGDGGARGVQDSGITIDDSDNLGNAVNISGTGSFTISGSISAEGATFKVAGTATSGGLHIQDMACDINNDGGDFDFRVQGDTDKSLFFLDASIDFVGIGATTPTQKLDVVEDRASNYAARFFNDGDNVNRHGIKIQGGSDANGDGTNFVDFFDGDGDQFDSLVTATGAIEIASASDPRLKENMTTSSLYLKSGRRDQLFKKGCVIDFTWKKNGMSTYGWNAEELRKIYPDAVIEMDVLVRQPDGTFKMEKRLYLLRGKLIAPMFAEIQEQRKADDLQVRQIEWLRAEAESRGVDMSTFPLQ